MSSPDKNHVERIGILDYGIGGLGVYALLKQHNFSSPISYISDAGFTPYGKLSRTELSQRVDLMIDKCWQMGIRKLLIACNAASTVLPRPHPAEMEVLGFTGFGVQAVKQSGVKEVLLLGGGRTVRAGNYRRSLELLGINVRQRISQPLSIHIEAGDTNSSALNNLVQQYLKDIRPNEALLLACTHYPAITPLFQKFLPKGNLIIDPALTAADYITSKWNYSRVMHEDIFHTSGDKNRMRAASIHTFNISIGEIHSIF